MPYVDYLIWENTNIDEKNLPSYSSDYRENDSYSTAVLYSHLKSHVVSKKKKGYPNSLYGLYSPIRKMSV